MKTDQSDSEWEYEYDPTETETFYVTLDLSSATHDTLSRIKRDKSKVTIAAPKGTVEDAPADTRPGEQVSSYSVAGEESLGSRIQILDLHSENPLISFDGHLYSCTWTRTLGTDLILAGPEIELPFVAVHRDDEFQIAAFSNIRLVGKTASLVPEKPPATSEDVPTDTSTAGRIKIPLSATVTDERRKQAAFLERIAAVKRVKGDTDEVFISRGKSYKDFIPGAEGFDSPSRHEKAKGKRKNTLRKDKARDAIQPRGGDTDLELGDSTERSLLAGPSFPVGSEGDLRRKGEEADLALSSARVIDQGEAENQAEASDVEMRDEG